MEDITVSVGNKGDVGSINEALKLLNNKYCEFFEPDKLLVNVLLLSGFVMNEQVFVGSANLGWIRIISVDPEVLVKRSAMKKELSTQSEIGMRTRPCFGVVNGGCLPRIGTVFKHDSNGKESYLDGIVISGPGSRVYFEPGGGFKNAGFHNIVVTNGGHTLGYQVVATGAGNNGLHVIRGSSVTMPFIDCSDAFHSGMNFESSHGDVRGCKCINVGKEGNGHHGIWLARGSIVNAEGCDFSEAGGGGVLCQVVSSINMAGGRCDNVKRCAIIAQKGSIIDASRLKARNAGQSGAIADEGSVIICPGADFSGAQHNGLVSDRSSLIEARAVKAVGVGQSEQSSSACIADRASVINADLANFSNAYRYCVSAFSGSRVSVRRAIADSAGADGIVARGASHIDAQHCQVRKARLCGILAEDASHVNFQEGDCRYAGLCGIKAINGSNINAYGANAGMTTTEEQPDVINRCGSFINFHHGKGTICSHANIMSEHGVIFRSNEDKQIVSVHGVNE